MVFVKYKQFYERKKTDSTAMGRIRYSPKQEKPHQRTCKIRNGQKHQRDAINTILYITSLGAETPIKIQTCYTNHQPLHEPTKTAPR